MNKKQSMKAFLVLGTIVAVAMIGITSSNARVYAGGYGNDDDISWKKFKNSNTYEDANKKTQKCSFMTEGPQLVPNYRPFGTMSKAAEQSGYKPG